MTTRTKQTEHALTARMVLLDNDPAQLYLTAEGAAALITELRRMKTPMLLPALFQYVHRGRLPVAGYLQGSVALFRPADVQALVGTMRRPDRRPRTNGKGDKSGTDTLPDTERKP